MLCGISTGKTFTGAHFAIKNILEHPELTGCVCANTYDQLSQATLRELFYWLEEYGLKYVIDRQPPLEWKCKRGFKSYNNILSVRIGNQVAHIFTRVLSNADALRGIEFSWYWLDETRDTPRESHDVILSRLRESEMIKGLITTTTAGEDWCYERFVKRADGILYGCQHIPTSASVEYGIVSEEFYQALRHSYSPLMAAQELDAQHVIALDGRCYYTYGKENQRHGFCPDPELPLIVGMDFNFSPAPMVWEVGQLSEDHESIHWFDEFDGVEISTKEMARRVGYKYGDFFLRIFGDASGNRGTTSNAGETDYSQIAAVLADMGVAFTIDCDQANPRVKDRVENNARLLKDCDGVVSQTLDPDRCPLLAKDYERVAWKNGKPSDGGDCTLTHASDGAGYALMKVLPPLARAATIGNTIASPHR
jgi:hypothetical protein